MTTVAILGHPTFTRPLGTAVARLGLFPIMTGPRSAAAKLGSLLDARLLVFGAPPGAWRTLEAEAYTRGTPVLHVSWDTDVASVGPLAVRGAGPCYACLAEGNSTKRRTGQSGALGDWVLATAALEVQGAIMAGASALVGASVGWSISRPGLTYDAWPPRGGCRTSGCSGASA